MAQRLLKVAVVDTRDGTVSKRFILVADIHEAYSTTWTIDEKTYTGTMIERYVTYGALSPQHITIDEEVTSFVARFNALTDCPPCPDPSG